MEVWEELTDEEALIAEFERMEVLLTGHFVLTSKPEGSEYRRHSSAYVNKDVVSSYPYDLADIIDNLVDEPRFKGIDLVVAPAVGAIPFGVLLASAATSRFAYAELKDGKMVFGRGFDLLVKAAKRIVLVEDIVTSGSTVKLMIEAVKELGKEIEKVVVLWQRGELNLDDVEVISLVKREYPVWIAEECEPCKQGIRPNTNVGHGKEFLAEFGEDPANWPANKQ